MVPLPRLPRWLSWALICIGIALTALKAALFGTDAWVGEPDSWLERFANDGLGILAGVSLAAGGINGFAQWIQRRLHKRETAALVQELLRRASRGLVEITQSAYAIVAPAFPPNGVYALVDEFSVGTAFNVELLSDKSRSYDQLRNKFDEVAKFLEKGAPPEVHNEVVRVGREHLSGICDGAQGVRSLTGQLTNYRDKEARSLVEAATLLEQSALDLKDYLLGKKQAAWGTQAESAVRQVDHLFKVSHDLHAPLCEAYRDVTLTMNPDLRAFAKQLEGG